MFKSLKEERVEKELERCGVKKTPGRRAVLSFFLKETHPVSIRSVHKAIGTNKIAHTTIYRTVLLFLSVGLVREIHLQSGESLFELADRTHHHHLICRFCGYLEDIHACGLDGWISQVKQGSHRFASIDDHSVELFGTCRECAKRGE